MFNKPPARPTSPGATSAPAPLAPSGPSEPQAPRRNGPKVASLIAEGMAIEGTLIGEGELHIDGAVRGDLKVGRLTIGENGVVEGSVIAEAIECRGRVSGTMSAKQVRLYGSAHVDGDITHEQLAMETGAFFQGRSLRLQRPPQPAAAAPAPAPQAPRVEPRPEAAKPAELKSGDEAPAAPRPAEAKPAGEGAARI